MILPSLTAEHNALLIVRDKLDDGEIGLDEIREFVREQIDIHYRDEESIFFPAFREHAPDDVAAMLAAHDRIREAYVSLTEDE